jgi:hypothetical protein
VDYVRSFLPIDETADRKNGAVAFSYTVGAQVDSAGITPSPLLGRPTGSSVAVNVFPAAESTVYFEYGTSPGVYSQKTETMTIPAGKPFVQVMDSLKPDTRYYYRMRSCQPGGQTFDTGPVHEFHTQRPTGSVFSFAVEADPHLDDATSPELFRQTLNNIAAGAPDFLVDLGDTFMSEKLAIPSLENITGRHVLLRTYFDTICHSIPLFLVLGNHEGELGWLLNGTADNLAVRAATIRKQYYPNPEPDAFYSGNSNEEPFVGQQQNYYAWEWGDALFVVLDPYWYTGNKPGKGGDNWGWSLGRQQYDWLRETLGKSRAFKFVFCHQLVGGGSEGRGGAELTGYYEWGGKNADGTWGFDVRRPGWEKTIHQLLVENRVNIFFHGHDHFFAKQELDGVIYQLVPQPGCLNYNSAGKAETYGYKEGVILPGSGYLRVTVSETEAKTDFIRAWLPPDETESHKNGETAHSYTIPAVHAPSLTPEESRGIPQSFSLGQNIPNPFNPRTTIHYELSAGNMVHLQIFDHLGRKIKTLVNQYRSPGTHIVDWDGTDERGRSAGSGLYFCRMQVEGKSITHKLLLLR